MRSAGEEHKEHNIRRLSGTAKVGEISEEAVAFYVTKYASKGAEAFGVSLARRIRTTEELATVKVRPHIGSAVRIAWILGSGGPPEVLPKIR